MQNQNEELLMQQLLLLHQPAHGLPHHWLLGTQYLEKYPILAKGCPETPSARERVRRQWERLSQQHGRHIEIG
ncbi:hypothetical protein EVAR_95567_1 [Eumeta japonica]|uniref:Uncharacterized protein n=1 Tax=Eumeta variegata TaxID=151549 RepID=A0A4C1ZVT8_EUMVA|nr:hypothetical protein EVAR_95567_1 [Eumeta japonica]